MDDKMFGIILIIFGVIYIVKPTIFRRGIWKKKAITQQIFSEKNYKIYMRALGGGFVIIGVLLLLNAK